MKLGTYSTIDVPTAQEKEAQEWLTAQFEAIGGTVRRVINPHDFGSYPSFEIDYPASIEKANEFVDEYDDDQFENNDELEAKRNEYEKEIEVWHSKANAIEAEYSKKFSDFL
jgi:hypothetical protein